MLVNSALASSSFKIYLDQEESDAVRRQSSGGLGVHILGLQSAESLVLSVLLEDLLLDAPRARVLFWHKLLQANKDGKLISR